MKGLKDYLNGIESITNQIVSDNCFSHETIDVIEGITRINTTLQEVLQSVNSGIFKGDKGDDGDTPNIQVGTTQTVEPGNQAKVIQTGDKLNPVLNFKIPKGEKGDTGKPSESINDDIIDLEHTWSSKKIDNLFNDIKEIEGLKYSTDNSYKVMKGTKNGVVKDLKIYGKSLVSKFSKKHTETNITVLYSGVLSTTDFKVEIGKTYTILGSVKSPTQNMCDLYYQESNVNIGTFKGNPFIFTANKNETLRFVSLETGLYVMDDIMVLEGDYSQNPPSYFEGIASVGNGNEIEVLSCNKNLFNPNMIFEKGNLNIVNGNVDYHSDRVVTDFIRIPSNTKLTRNVPNGFGCVWNGFYDSNKNYLGQNLAINANSYISPQNACFVRYIFIKTGLAENLSDQDILRKTAQLEIGDTISTYTEPKQDKKTILFKDVDNTWKPVTNLRGIDETNCDVVDSVNGKLDIKCNEIIANGSESIFLVSERTDTIGFGFNLPKKGYEKNIGMVISDRFNFVGSDDSEQIRLGNGGNSVFIFINKSKLDTLDIAGFMKWLKANNTKIVYLLEETSTYEINPLFPNSYENETMLSFNTNCISYKKEWYVDSNLGSLVLLNEKRIDKLENDIYNVNKAILRGDMRFVAEKYYPEDFE